MGATRRAKVDIKVLDKELTQTFAPIFMPPIKVPFSRHLFVALTGLLLP